MAQVSSLDVTLDTCVLLPITLCDTLLRFVDAGFYRPHWSKETLDELARNLSAKFNLDPAAARRRIDHMTEAFPEALVDGYELLVPAMLNHPKDRHVLAAAVKRGSQVIVTSNLKDFPAHALEPLDIEAQPPDRFLLDLNDLDPRLCAAVMLQQAAEKSRPPITVDAILDRLAVNAPRFASGVRTYLGLPVD